MRDRVLLSPADLAENDPFIAVTEDAMVAPGGFPLHPHRGFDLITMVFEGALVHEDSLGTRTELEAGDLQWQSTAAGVLHSEHPRGAQTCKILQIWLNTPAQTKTEAPAYALTRAAELSETELDPLWVKVIAGDFRGVRGPAQARTPLDLWDLRAEDDGEVRLPLAASRRGFVLVLEGEVRIGARARVARTGHVARLANEEVAGLRVQFPRGARFLVCAGDPLRETVVTAGPFVSDSRETLAEALAEFHAGRFSDEDQDSGSAS